MDDNKENLIILDKSKKIVLLVKRGLSKDNIIKTLNSFPFDKRIALYPLVIGIIAGSILALVKR